MEMASRNIRLPSCSAMALGYKIPADVHALVMLLLNENKANRPTMEELKKSNSFPSVFHGGVYAIEVETKAAKREVSSKDEEIRELQKELGKADESKRVAQMAERKAMDEAAAAVEESRKCQSVLGRVSKELEDFKAEAKSGNKCSKEMEEKNKTILELQKRLECLELHSKTSEDAHKEMCIARARSTALGNALIVKNSKLVEENVVLMTKCKELAALEPQLRNTKEELQVIKSRVVGLEKIAQDNEAYAEEKVEEHAALEEVKKKLDKRIEELVSQNRSKIEKISAQEQQMVKLKEKIHELETELDYWATTQRKTVPVLPPNMTLHTYLDKLGQELTNVLADIDNSGVGPLAPAAAAAPPAVEQEPQTKRRKTSVEFIPEELFEDMKNLTSELQKFLTDMSPAWSTLDWAWGSQMQNKKALDEPPPCSSGLRRQDKEKVLSTSPYELWVTASLLVCQQKWEKANNNNSLHVKRIFAKATNRASASWSTVVEHLLKAYPMFAKYKDVSKKRRSSVQTISSTEGV